MATMEYEVTESTTRNRTIVLTIPNLKSVSNVLVNTGNVTFSIDGEELTINVSNGAYTRYTTSSYTPSEYAVSYSQGGYGYTFPDSKSHSQNGKTGTLYKSGGSYFVSGTYTPSDGRTEYAYTSQTGCADWVWTTGSPGSWSSGGTYFPSYPSSVPYDSGGYSGTLTSDGVMAGAYGSAKPSYNGTSNGQTATTCTGYRQIQYSGSVTKPASDTRVYEQKYDGYVYGSTEYTNTYYYAYDLTIEYLAFAALEELELPFPDDFQQKENLVYLRDRANEFRVSNGVEPMTWTDSDIVEMVTPIKALHWNEVQDAIEEVYTSLGHAFVNPETEQYVKELIVGRTMDFPVKELQTRMHKILYSLMNQ
jgi:hypothetical protein